MRADARPVTETRPRDLWIAIGVALVLHGFAAVAGLKWYVASLERPSAGASATTINLAAYSNAPPAAEPVPPQPEPETPAVVEPPKPAPAPVRRAAPAEPKPEERQAEEAPAPPPAVTPGPAGLARAGAANTGVGQETMKADYYATVSAWLARHKQYPRMAQRQNREGKGRVFIHIARDGRLLAYRVTQETGSVVLDRELTATVERAAPMPPFPPGLAAATLKFEVPITFEIVE